MDMGSYTFKALEEKYEGFFAPAFNVTVGGKKLESSKVHFSSISVEISGGAEAGGCSFTIESQYDYEGSSWMDGLLDTVKVGAKIEIEAGYVTKKGIFYGFVDDFTVEYSAGEAPRIVVNGIDAKGFLMNAKDCQYAKEKSTSTFVRSILNECKTKGYATKLQIGAITGYKAELVQEEMDDFKFLCFISQIYNMSFLVINGEIVFDSLMKSQSAITSLTMGIGLLSFKKKMTLRDAVGKVTVNGIDPVTLEPITGEATKTSAAGSGKSATQIASGFSSVETKQPSFFVQTKEECTKYAQALFDQKAFSFVTAQATCVGIPELIPGRFIDIEGIDKSTASRYFIEKVTHEFGPDGYLTNLVVKGAKSL